tara:strand:- start:6312 stop:6935 length:624 start_codon:yes stop_codon:yes gene_type:complete
MSHNKIKIGTATANRAGNIDISISDLSDVTLSSPGNNQVLKYNGSAWVNVASGGGGEMIIFGQGETSAYSNSPASSLSAGQTIYAYDTNPVNTISGANLSTTNNWLNSFTLPAGEYLLCAIVACEFSASGYLGFAYYSSSSLASHVAYVGDNVVVYDGAAGFIQSYLNISSATTLNLEIEGASNVDTVANQGNTISEATQIVIIKLG